MAESWFGVGGSSNVVRVRIFGCALVVVKEIDFFFVLTTRYFGEDPNCGDIFKSVSQFRLKVLTRIRRHKFFQQKWFSYYSNWKTNSIKTLKRKELIMQKECECIYACWYIVYKSSCIFTPSSLGSISLNNDRYLSH